MSELLSVQEAQQRILALFQPVEKTTAALDSAAGRVLCEPVSAKNDLPPFSNSSMDGYAVLSADLVSATMGNPVTLRVVGDIPAGLAPNLRLASGQAARIMTGAPLPDGADAVIPVEDTRVTAQDEKPFPTQIQVLKALQSGDYVRPQGQDIRQGQVVLNPNRRLQPQDLGLLSMLGVSLVPVYRQPRVGLITTGDELIPPDQTLSPGKIRDANSYTLAELIRQTGGEVFFDGITPDDPQAIRARFNAAADRQVDLILTSAGVSVGAYDYVREIITEEGKLHFWRVNMRPGKPLAFGSYRGIPVIGLPGNPVSAFVGFLVFVSPVLRRLSGLATALPPLRSAMLLESIQSDGRESYLRAVAGLENGRMVVRLTGDQNSGNLFSLVQGNALLIVPSGVKSLPSGSEVKIWLLTEDVIYNE